MFLNSSKIKGGWKTSQNVVCSWLTRAGQNLSVMLWVTVIYLAANLLVAGLLLIKKRLWPSLIIEELVLAQVIAFMVFALTVGLLYGLPKLLSLKNQWLQQLKFNKNELGLNDWMRWRDIGLAVAGFVLAIVFRVAMIIVISQYWPDFNIQQKQDLGFSFGRYNSRLELSLVFFTLVVLAPIAEEIIFRGYLFAKIRTRSSFLTTTLLVSGLFGLAHYLGGGWISVVVTAALSLAMCLTREVSQSLYASILIHMINNGLAFAVLLNFGS